MVIDMTKATIWLTGLPLTSYSLVDIIPDTITVFDRKETWYPVEVHQRTRTFSNCFRTHDVMMPA